MMQMRHTAHELRVTLDHVLQGGDAPGAPQNSQDEGISFLNEPEAEMRAVHDIQEVRPRVKCWEEFFNSHLVIIRQQDSLQLQNLLISLLH